MTLVALVDFISFIREQRIGITAKQNGVINRVVVEISQTDLPDDSQDIARAYKVARATVSEVLGDFYDVAFLNLAMHLLIRYSNAEIFDNIKSFFNSDALRVGIIGSASDSGTSASWQAIPEFLTHLNAYENQLLTTPYGRNYYEIANQFASLRNWV